MKYSEERVFCVDFAIDSNTDIHVVVNGIPLKIHKAESISTKSSANFFGWGKTIFANKLSSFVRRTLNNGWWG